MGDARDHPQIFTEVADSLASLKHHGHALKYYTMLEANGGNVSVRIIMPIPKFLGNINTHDKSCKYLNILRDSDAK